LADGAADAVSDPSCDVLIARRCLGVGAVITHRLGQG
jgi:hypothetical protein